MAQSNAERAIQFLKGIVPGFPPAITEANLCKYLRSGVVLCKCAHALYHHHHLSFPLYPNAHAHTRALVGLCAVSFFFMED